MCLEEEGNVQFLRCPYHAWTYDLQGKLITKKALPDGINADELGLHKCHVREANGMIFLCLDRENEPGGDFDMMMSDVAQLVNLHLTNSKVACRVNYEIYANWKLVVGSVCVFVCICVYLCVCALSLSLFLCVHIF